jgi:FkbH-like protein
MQTGSQQNLVLGPERRELSLEQLARDPRRQAEARARMAAEIAASPTTLTYLRMLNILPPATLRRRIAIVSSFTIETVAPFLEVEGYLSRWRPELRCIQYSQWQPALLEPDGALAGADFVVVLIDDRIAGRELGASPAEAAAAIRACLDGFRRRSAAPLLVGLVPTRPEPASVFLSFETHQAALRRVQAVNAAIAEFCEARQGCDVLDVPGIMTRAGSAWHDFAGFASKMSYVSHKALPPLAEAIARHVGASLVARHKVLVTDLDNTMWGGIVGEDGPDGVATGGKGGSAYTAYQKFLGELRASGVLLAMASKNHESDARSVFERRAADLSIAWDDFAATRVNWDDKAESLRAISDELGLGLDAMVFVDDSPVECERIRQSLPMVCVVQAPPGCAGLPEKIMATRAFDTTNLSAEDRGRAQSYRRERDRKSAAEASADIASFLASLGLSAAFRPLSAGNLERVTQLLAKTNQFHLTLERPSSTTLLGRQRAGNLVYAVSLRDRFGDYGIIAVVEFERADPTMVVRNLAVSCRALGRSVEEAIVAHAAARAREAGLDGLEAEFVAGPRNQLVPEALARIGFSAALAADGKTRFRLAVTADAPAWPAVVNLDPTDEAGNDAK